MSVVINVVKEEEIMVCIQDECAPVEVNEDIHIIKEVVGVTLASSPLAITSDGEGNIAIS